MENQIQSVISEMWQEACENGRTVSFRISSGSMRPAIEIGDIVRVRRVAPSEIRIGDIVAFKNGRQIIVHRIFRISRANGGVSFIQMGDATSASKSLEAKKIIGKVIAINKNGRDVDLGSPRQVIGNRIFGWRASLIDYIRRGRHNNINTGLKFLFRPVWRLCRSLLLRHA